MQDEMINKPLSSFDLFRENCNTARI